MSSLLCSVADCILFLDESKSENMKKNLVDAAATARALGSQPSLHAGHRWLPGHAKLPPPVMIRADTVAKIVDRLATRLR